MRRRDFVKTTGLVTAGALLEQSALLAAPATKSKPNVLLIITDQQFADAMSCAVGRDYIHTPHMDALAAQGRRFTRAYCANPLCVPSRSAMFSGRFCHEVGNQTNNQRAIDPERFPCLGRVFRDAGYDTGFFGKWHMPYNVRKPKEHGFDTVEGKSAIYSGAPAAKFIAAKRERPFFAVASFMNPHNICEWSRGQNLPGGTVGEPPAPSDCPPSLPNADPPRGETDIIAHMRKSYQAHRLFPVSHYTDGKWRQFRWAYYRLVEKVDRHVGTLLAALRKTGQEENTVVAFLGDHGDCQGAHRWNQKTVFYDEATRVPFIVAQKGATPPGTCDALVQTGVDLMPTLCDFAGIAPPPGLPGRSLRPYALGKASDKGPACIVSSNHMVQCEPVDGVLLKPQGRMVRSQRYKYCLYDAGQRRESLVDMEKDPGEMVNLAAQAEHRDTLLAHRKLLGDFATRHDDKTALAMLAAL